MALAFLGYLGYRNVTLTMTTYTFYQDSDTPAVLNAAGLPDGATDNTPYSMGLKFSVSENCKCLGIRYYRPGNEPVITHVGELYNLDTNTKLSDAIFLDDTGQGWRIAYFLEPVNLQPGVQYIGFSNRGNFSNVGYYYAKTDYFTSVLQRGIIVTPLAAQTFGNYSSLPLGSFRASAYWTDVVLSTSTNQRLQTTASINTKTRFSLRTNNKLISRLIVNGVNNLKIVTPKKIKGDSQQGVSTRMRLRTDAKLQAKLLVNVSLGLKLKSLNNITGITSQQVNISAYLEVEKRIQAKLLQLIVQKLEIRYVSGKLKGSASQHVSTKLGIRISNRLIMLTTQYTNISLTIKGGSSNIKYACMKTTVKPVFTMKVTIKGSC